MRRAEDEGSENQRRRQTDDGAHARRAVY